MQHAVIESVRVKGFRSLANVEFSELPQAAVLIGANGSGKSNFIRFFEMMSWMLRSKRLGEFVEMQGGADDQLFRGSRNTSRINAEIRLRTDQGLSDYRFELTRGHPDRFFFTEEAFRFSSASVPGEAEWQYLDSGHREAAIINAAHSPDSHGVNPTTARVIVNLLRSCAVYQFHDTSDSSNFTKRWDAEDSDQLRSHGGNLAAVLYRLEREDARRYEFICRQINRVLPNFDRFDMKERHGKVSLRWKAKNHDKTLGAHLTSDGSLRFFSLVTLLKLPSEMLPSVILLDEPELGLHPAAISLVGGMIKSLSADRQVIVATQSPLLVDAFDLGEIVTLNLREGRTEPRKPDPEELRDWLEDFTTGELWQKNLLGGRP